MNSPAPVYSPTTRKIIPASGELNSVSSQNGQSQSITKKPPQAPDEPNSPVQTHRNSDLEKFAKMSRTTQGGLSGWIPILNRDKSAKVLWNRLVGATSKMQLNLYGKTTCITHKSCSQTGSCSRRYYRHLPLTK